MIITIKKHSFFVLDTDDANITQFYEETLVSFGDLPDNVIHAYIATGEPMWVILISSLLLPLPSLTLQNTNCEV